MQENRIPGAKTRIEGEVIGPDDPRHPANDPAHPDHERMKRELRAIRERAEAAQQEEKSRGL